jgi:hypothetical protein
MPRSSEWSLTFSFSDQNVVNKLSQNPYSSSEMKHTDRYDLPIMSSYSSPCAKNMLKWFKSVEEFKFSSEVIGCKSEEDWHILGGTVF